MALEWILSAQCLMLHRNGETAWLTAYGRSRNTPGSQDRRREQEGYDRSFYTGFLGELNCEKRQHKINRDPKIKKIESNLFVNLRCMQILSEPKPGVIIYVGGGVTSGSNPVSEWDETVDKSLVMKSVLLGIGQELD